MNNKELSKCCGAEMKTYINVSGLKTSKGNRSVCSNCGKPFEPSVEEELGTSVLPDNYPPESSDNSWEISMYNLRGDWVNEESKKNILEQINKHIYTQIQKAKEEERALINKKWLELNLSNSNMLNWGKELDSFSLYIQGFIN